VTLDRAHVVKAAITLLDEVGLDGLTLRRLAKELNVQAPALYWHFKNKQELLDQMVVAMYAAEARARPPRAGEAWDDWLADRCRQIHNAQNAHRDGAMLAASTHPQDNQWPDIEMQIDVMCQAGLSAGDALRALIALSNYVSGFTLEEQADRMRGQTGPDDAEFAAAMEMLAPYPRLSEALREVGDPHGPTAFESGLQMIMDGLRKRVADASG
jgi:TetR/AcrR family tetracycline transcriptional repressor